MQANQIEISSSNKSAQACKTQVSEDDYANGCRKWGIDLDHVVECIVISEWLDWAKQEISEVGLPLPDDETLVLLIWTAVCAGKRMLEKGEFSSEELAAESVGVTVAVWCPRLSERSVTEPSLDFACEAACAAVG